MKNNLKRSQAGALDLVPDNRKISANGVENSREHCKETRMEPEIRNFRELKQRRWRRQREQQKRNTLD